MDGSLTEENKLEVASRLGLLAAATASPRLPHLSGGKRNSFSYWYFHLQVIRPILNCTRVKKPCVLTFCALLSLQEQRLRVTLVAAVPPTPPWLPVLTQPRRHPLPQPPCREDRTSNRRQVRSHAQYFSTFSTIKYVFLYTIVSVQSKNLFWCDLALLLLASLPAPPSGLHPNMSMLANQLVSRAQNLSPGLQPQPLPGTNPDLLKPDPDGSDKKVNNNSSVYVSGGRLKVYKGKNKKIASLLFHGWFGR